MRGPGNRGATYGDRADEVAPRREVKVFGRGMLLVGILQPAGLHSAAAMHTSLCAVYESGDKFATSGLCQEWRSWAGIGRLVLSRLDSESRQSAGTRHGN